MVASTNLDLVRSTEHLDARMYVKCDKGIAKVSLRWVSGMRAPISVTRVSSILDSRIPCSSISRMRKKNRKRVFMKSSKGLPKISSNFFLNFLYKKPLWQLALLGSPVTASPFGVMCLRLQKNRGNLFVWDHCPCLCVFV